MHSKHLELTACGEIIVTFKRFTICPQLQIQDNFVSGLQNNIMTGLQNNIIIGLQNNIMTGLQDNIRTGLQNNIMTELKYKIEAILILFYPVHYNNLTGFHVNSEYRHEFDVDYYLYYR